MKATNKALEMHRLKNEPLRPISTKQIETAPSNNQLFIKSDKRLIQVEVDDIYFLENYGNYVKIWLKDEYHLTPGSLSSFEQQLPASNFFRIHKSYMINRTYIDYIEGNKVVTKNGKSLAIGKLNRATFRAFIGK